MTRRNPRETFPLASAAIFPLGAVALIFAAHALLPWHLVECRFFEWTKIPCPGCGVLRCLDAMARFQPREALRWNPLAFFLVLAAFAQPALVIRPQLVRAFASRGGACLLTALVFANWIYLCFTLPR